MAKIDAPAQPKVTAQQKRDAGLTVCRWALKQSDDPDQQRADAAELLEMLGIDHA